MREATVPEFASEADERAFRATQESADLAMGVGPGPCGCATSSRRRPRARALGPETHEVGATCGTRPLLGNHALSGGADERDLGSTSSHNTTRRPNRRYSYRPIKALTVGNAAEGS